MTKKRKVLALCDNPLSPSGVGCQARHLMSGLIETGRWSFRVFGGAIRHKDYSVVRVSDDLIIKPVDGFGTPMQLREALIKERPDVLFMFTDPRFFVWVWEMEDEIHQICPIAYWHVWDNDPFPQFNDVYYRSTDLINCISRRTYDLVKNSSCPRVNYVPHALPDVFRPLPAKQVDAMKVKILGDDRRDDFVVLWVNRNARRKMPGNVILSFSLFLDELERRFGHRHATLLMHTNPLDHEGQHLPSIVEHLGVTDNVRFSVEILPFEGMASLYNVADVTVNIACHEGFGLSTLESLQCGTPIVALKTGGLTHQVTNIDDPSVEYGVALDPDVRDLVGSQTVPYIYEDHVAPERVADALMLMYEMGPDARAELGKRGREYALSAFSYERMVSEWDRTLTELVDEWRLDAVRSNRMVTI